MDSRDSDADDTAGTGHCPLRLYTLAGKEIETIVPISIYHHWEMLEDYLVELLARNFDLDTFGCELMLIAEDARSPLSDPIHEELWENKGFQLVIHKSFRQVRSKEQIRRDDYEDHPKAIWVPANESGILPAKAFFALARLRRVQVEVGHHTTERQVWRYCHTLTIVKLPSSVVTIANAVFQGCYALTTVMMPGRLSLGARLFAECCALEQVGVPTGNSCRLVRGATISPYAFEGCERLKQAHWPVVGLALWWEMSSDGKCPLTGNVLWWVFPCLCTFRPSGRKRLLVGKVLWWELSSGGACPTCFPTLLYLPNCYLPKLCLTRVCFPTTPAPPGVSFPPLLLHKGLLHTVLFPPLLFHMFFLSDPSCFTRVCFTQFSSHHSCSTSFFFPTTPASQGFASHSSLPPLLHKGLLHTVPSPPLLLHKGLLHTFLSPPLLLHKGFASPPLLPHKGLLSHHSCSTKVCLPTTPAPQGFASHSSPPALFRKALPQDFPPLLLHRNLFSLHSGFTRLDHTRTTPASLEFASLDSPTTPV